MIVANINVTKILKQHLFEGKNGKYLDLVLFENKAGRDQYGNDGFVTQSVSKAAREAGERGPILGNWKRLPDKNSATAPATPTPTPTSAPAAAPVEEDEIPF